MQDTTTEGLAADADVTLVIRVAEGAPTGPPARRGALRADGSHAAFPRTGDAHATLTVLTGLKAGHVMAIEGAPITIGRARDADLVVGDAGVSRHHVRFTHMARGGFCVEDLSSTNGTFLGAARVGVAILHRDDMLQLGPQLRIRFAIVDSIDETLQRDLYESSVHDPLTRAFNRGYLAGRLLAEIVRARRTGGDVAVLMIDVDSLKAVNDRFGHPTGDRALCSVATRILGILRVGDVLARYGGDEFVVLAPGVGPAEALELAERIRCAVGGLSMEASGGDLRLTTSIGVASLTELSTVAEPSAALLAITDARMYGAKASGRSRVYTTSRLPSGSSPSDG